MRRVFGGNLCMVRMEKLLDGFLSKTAIAGERSKKQYPPKHNESK